MKRRILHVVGSLDPGGVEASLLLLCERAEKENLSFDFLTLIKRGRLATVAERYGCSVYSPDASCVPEGLAGFMRFRSFFRKFLLKHRYDAVHCHVLYLAGPIMAAARAAGVSGRVVQIHTPAEAYHSSLKGRLNLRISLSQIYRHATAILGVSRSVLLSCYGEESLVDPRVRVVPAVFDVVGSLSLSRRKTLPKVGTFAVIQVGRFHPVKNHRFTLKVAEACLKRGSKIQFTLVGDGPLREILKEEAQKSGVDSIVDFPGISDDVPGLLADMGDLFIFPSLYEGVPMALLEAQAIGLPCLVSEGVSEDAVIIEELVTRLELADPAVWAEEIDHLLRENVGVPDGIRERFEKTLFNPENNIRVLGEIYSDL